MRRKLIAPAALALVGVLLLSSPGWAPPPAPRPPAPTPVRPPTTTPRPPGTTYRPPITGPRPPAPLPPNFGVSMEAARRRSAAEAADLLRQQSAASISRAQRAAMLNAITHQMLLQRQAASLAQLRQLRTDWTLVGPGAGLDPIVAMQLEAAESAAERLLLAEILQLVRDGQFAAALARLEALGAPRYLSAVVVQALPDLRAALGFVVPFARVQAELKGNASYRATVNPLSDVPPARRPAAVNQAVLVWGSLARVQELLEGQRTADPLDAIELDLKSVEKAHGGPLAGKLRAELSAQLFLLGRAEDAAKLLDGEVDPVHAAAVLADLRAVILGRGEITTAQVAAFVPADRTAPPPQAVAILPADRLAQWKPPTRKPGTTTIDAAVADARLKLKSVVDVEVVAGTTKVNAAADRIRAALAAEAAPLKVFLDKVEAARGTPFVAPAERELAAVAGARGLTVAEVVGVLAVEADRPASAARLLATVPALADIGSFAALVEVSGRAPAGFAAHPDAGFKLAPVRDRARIREAMRAVLNAQAGKIVAKKEPPDLERLAVEAEVHTRLGLAPDDVLTPAECVQALLDVCRDWADEYDQLSAALREWNQTVADIEAGEYGPDNDELKELTSAVKLRRLTVQTDKKRREAGVGIGCQLLGAYGADGTPAASWLEAQTQDKPWYGAAMLNAARINEGK